MSRKNSVAPDKAPQTMTLYDSYRPAIPAGDYRLVVQQSVHYDRAASAADQPHDQKEPSSDGNGDRPSARAHTHHYYRDQRFIVQGPRYYIAPQEIHAMFPPRDGRGDYSNFLPHLIFSKRALPWERSLFFDDNNQALSQPWLALLLMPATELQQVWREMGKAASVASEAGVSIGRYLDIISPADLLAGNDFHQQRADGFMTRVPKLPDKEDRDDHKTQLQVLDLPLSYFRSLCPNKADLLYLAHVRTVSTIHKVPLNMHADGDFSVIIGNRFPQPGANIAFLVSLEGWQDVIDCKYGGPADRVRLITFMQWQFENDPNGVHTFGELMQELDVDRLRVRPAATGESGDAGVDGALAHGHIPVTYKPSRSTPTLGWYRGPLTPVRTTRFNSSGQLLNRADAALVYDPKTGLFDLSYAIAWQLGRLLALSSSSVVRELRLFVRKQRDAFDAAGELAAFLALHRTAMARYRQQEQAAGEAGRPTAGQPADPEAVAKVAAADDLLQWLVRLVLLYPVSYRHLVAHPSLLPRESLRFFFIDDNWVEMLVDGALSSAVDCLRDLETVHSQRNALNKALSQLVVRYHKRLQGFSEKPDSDQSIPDVYMDETKSGFLLRSAVVAGWPGMDVECYDSSDNPLPVLRMDHLASELLFCVVQGELDHVIFREPAEGMHYGLEEDGTLMIRRWQTAPCGAPLSAADGEQLVILKNDVVLERPPVAGGSALPGVLDVVGVADIVSKRVSQAEHSANSHFFSAAFALQMSTSPSSQRIEWKLEETATGPSDTLANGKQHE